jgi:hypothetical protein
VEKGRTTHCLQDNPMSMKRPGKTRMQRSCFPFPL